MKDRALAERLENAFKRTRDLDASLEDKLQAFAAAVRRASPALAGAVDSLVLRLERGGAGLAAPSVGDPMPPFILPDQHGKLLSLDTLLDRGPVGVSFHRGHWCPYCRLNTSALAQAQCDVDPFGAQIVAITPDLQKFALALESDAEANPFPILIDVDNGYALSLNLAIWVGDELRSIMMEAGCDLAAFQGNDMWMLPIPATFIVAQDGSIRARFVDPDYRKRMDIGDMVAVLRATAMS